MAWCFSTRASVSTVLTTHPCVSRCLRVKLIELLFPFGKMWRMATNCYEYVLITINKIYVFLGRSILSVRERNLLGNFQCGNNCYLPLIGCGLITAYCFTDFDKKNSSGTDFSDGTIRLPDPMLTNNQWGLAVFWNLGNVFSKMMYKIWFG